MSNILAKHRQDRLRQNRAFEMDVQFRLRRRPQIVFNTHPHIPIAVKAEKINASLHTVSLASIPQAALRDVSVADSRVPLPDALLQSHHNTDPFTPLCPL